MRHLVLISSVFYLSSSAFGFECSKTDDVTYHGDVTTECQMYFMCNQGQTTTFRCQNGFSFDDSTSSCSDTSEFMCGDVKLNRKKRLVDMGNSVSKVKPRNKELESINSIITDAKHTTKKVSPTDYDIHEEKYVPILKSMKRGIRPIIKQDDFPRTQKVQAFAKNLEKGIFKKLHPSWKLSNSNQINFIPLSDIISEDLHPYKQLGKLFSSRIPTTRSKRSVVLARPLFDTVATFVQPVLKVAFKSLASAIGGDDPFMKDYFLPMIFEMLDDSQSTLQIREILWKANKIISPAAKQIFKSRRFRDSNGVTYMAVTPDLTRAIFRFYTEVEPIVTDIVKRHLQMILVRSAHNLPVITDTLERLSVYSRQEAKDLKHDILLFFAKHSEYYMTNDESFRNVHNFVQMSNDLMRMKRNLLKVFMAYVSHSPNSIVNLFINRNSALNRNV